MVLKVIRVSVYFLRNALILPGLTDSSATEGPDPKEEELKCSIEREKSK